MSKIKVLLFGGYIVFTLLITYNIINIKISYKTYNLKLGVVYSRNISVFDPNRGVLNLPIQYIWGGFLRYIPRFHPFSKDNLFGFRTIFDTLGKYPYYSSCLEFYKDDQDIRLSVFRNINILPEARNIFIKDKNLTNLPEDYMILYDAISPDNVKISSSPWALKATYLPPKNYGVWGRGLIGRILTSSRWERMDIEIVIVNDTEDIIKYITYDGKRRNKNVIYAFVVPSGMVDEFAYYHFSHFIIKDIGLYRIWFVHINSNLDYVRDTIIKIINTIFYEYVKSNSNYDEIYICNNCFIPTVIDSLKDDKSLSFNTEHSIDHGYPYFVSQYKVYLQDPNIKLYNDLYKRISNYFIETSNDDEADIILSTYIYDSKLDEWINIGNIFEMLGLHLEPVGDRELISYAIEQLKENKIYTVALEKMYLISNDSLPVKFLNFNIVQGFTGLWWNCPQE